MFMAAPSGLTRFTFPLCVGPLTAPRRGPRENTMASPPFFIIALLLALRSVLAGVDDHFLNHHRVRRPQQTEVAAHLAVRGRDRLLENLPRHVQPARHTAEDGPIGVHTRV